MHRTLTEVKHLTSGDLFALGTSEVDALDESPLSVDFLDVENLVENISTLCTRTPHMHKSPPAQPPKSCRSWGYHCVQ